MTKDVAWFFVWKSVISGNSREKWWYRTLHQPNSREKQIIKVLPTENVNYIKKRTTSRSLCVKVVRKLRNLLIFSVLCGAGNYRKEYFKISWSFFFRP